MKYETLQTLSQVLVLIGALLAAFGGFGSWYFGKLAQRTPITRQDLDDVVSNRMAVLSTHLNAHPVNERYPGLSIHMLLRFNELPDPRRKYLLDVGGHATSRLSIYLDASNVFAFSFIDALGETHVLRIPQGATGIPINQYIYLACELGIRQHSTMLRALVDGNEVASQDMPFKVNPGPFKYSGGVLGADLDGKNGGAFVIKHLIIRTQTLTTSEIQQIVLPAFATEIDEKSLLFTGTQWMRIGGPSETPADDVLHNAAS